MRPSKVMVMFRSRHVVPPYLDHIERSGRFIIQLFNKADWAVLDYDKAMPVLRYGVAVEPGPADYHKERLRLYG